RVRNRAAFPLQSSNRGDVDDRALPLLEKRKRGPTTIKSTLQVHAQDLIPNLIRQRIQIGVIDEARGAGVVDQNVEASELIVAAPYHGTDFSFDGDIAPAENSRHAMAFHFFERLLRLFLG